MIIFNTNRQVVMTCAKYSVILVAATLILAGHTAGEEGGSRWEQVAVVLGQLLEYHLSGCHLVLLTAIPHAPPVTDMLR